MKHFTIRTISTIMTIMMIVGFIAIPTFATDNNDPQEVAQSGFAEVDETQGGKEVATEDVAIIMESYIGEDQINDDVELENGEFSVNDSDMEVSIPENGDEVIVIQMEEGTIKMGLPDEVSNEAGILSENGTVIYDPDAENVAVGVHALYNGEGDNRWEAVRVLIEIKNADASKEYGFKFNLPEGCRLIEAERWFDLYISASSEDVVNKEEFFIPGEVYIVDKEGTVIETIDPAWAKDANGDIVPTYYEIRGNELVQIVEFDENTAFPVIADPTSHPNKTYYFYLNKKGVRKERDKYTGGSTANMASGILTLATAVCIAKGGVIAEVATPVGPALALVIVVGSDYNSRKYATWNKILNNFPSNKKYARIASTYKWHGGHKCYYPTGKLKATYTNKQW